jgi:hypothetical protein
LVENMAEEEMSLPILQNKLALAQSLKITN